LVLALHLPWFASWYLPWFASWYVCVAQAMVAGKMAASDEFQKMIGVHFMRHVRSPSVHAGGAQ